MNKEILDLLEFYFGDSNLSRDQWLRIRVCNHPKRYIELKKLLTFNKVQRLRARFRDLQVAVENSSKLELDQTGAYVRRKIPFDPNIDFTQRIVYLENVAPNETIETIKEKLARFGKVTFVELDWFRVSRQNKGFSFVEFETEEMANKCIETINHEQKKLLESKEEGQVNEEELEPNPKLKSIHDLSLICLSKSAWLEQKKQIEKAMELKYNPYSERNSNVFKINKLKSHVNRNVLKEFFDWISDGNVKFIQMDKNQTDSAIVRLSENVSAQFILEEAQEHLQRIQEKEGGCFVLVEQELQEWLKQSQIDRENYKRLGYKEKKKIKKLHQTLNKK
ncbi:la-related protein [Anaeramoeba flamelloides]|uniref:La-related protein n=1 Tax=Anaeramoeba flamelloides TaxID=1746091 RepID=A0AAV7YXX5_9EUKA|nr:la-related protein [Anaeramoeba flamelloides]